MPLYEVRMSVRTSGSESTSVHVWADSEREALRYADREIEYDSVDWYSDDNFEAEEDTVESYDAEEITDDPEEAREAYCVYNIDEIPRDEDEDEDEDEGEDVIARYNMGEDIPA